MAARHSSAIDSPHETNPICNSTSVAERTTPLKTELVGCSCSDDVSRKFLTLKLTTSLGGQVTCWKANKQTKELRVPVILSLRGCCRAFDLPSHTSRTDNKDAERFLRHFRQFVVSHHRDPDADPKPLAPECPGDTNLDIEENGAKDKVDAVVFVRYSSLLLDSTPVPSRALFLFEKRTALIVVASIALLRPVRESAPRMPHVMTFLLANGLGRVLAVFDSSPQDGAAVPPGDQLRQSTNLGGRNAFLYFGAPRHQQVLVKFHVGWTLTALSLVLPACRVVDLGADEAY